MNELLALGAFVIVQLILGLVATTAIGGKTGTGWLLGSRGDLPDFRDSLAGRLDRARSNGFEALILFTPVVVIVVETGSSSALTANAAWTYVGARVVYIFCYAADLVPWRTLVWFVGWGALLTMLVPTLMTMW